MIREMVKFDLEKSMKLRIKAYAKKFNMFVLVDEIISFELYKFFSLFKVTKDFNRIKVGQVYF